MATTRVYLSTDTGAPTLDGTAGSLLTVLDACLVSGFGAAVAAGWTKPYTGTNQAAFLSADGVYLQVLDDASGTAGAREALVRGYESMSSVSAGTNPFPTVAQVAAGLVMRKSNTLGAARPWRLFATESAFYLASDAENDGTPFVAAFGTYLVAPSSSMAAPYFLAARAVQDSADRTSPNEPLIRLRDSTGMTGLYVARDSTGAAGSAALAGFGITAAQSGGTNYFGNGSLTFPRPYAGAGADGLMGRVDLGTLTTGAYQALGRLPGFWHVMHAGNATGLTDMTIIYGAGKDVNRNCRLIHLDHGVDGTANLALEITNTWYTETPEPS